jgi:hypothetical protein
MKHTFALLALCGCSLAFAAPQGEISKDEYKTQRARIQDRYATNKDRCSRLDGHARDLCKVQARAEYDIARAELRTRYEPSPAHQEKAELAKGEASYRIAHEKCGDLDGSARKVCEQDARAGWTAARAEARANRTAGEKGPNTEQTLHAREKARETATQARYDAQRARCRTLSGDSKDTCIADAKKQFAVP